MSPHQDRARRGPARPPGQTRELVALLLREGLTRLEVARALGVSKSTVVYHARRLDLSIDEKCNRRYDWAEVQRYHDAGHTARECTAKFGFCSYTWHRARERGALVTRPAAAPIETYLVKDRRVNRRHLKDRLVAAGLKRPVCEICGIREWRGKPLSLVLHHINGDGSDNRLGNLQILCANCHSQTDNFAAKKYAGRARLRRQLLAIGAFPLDRRSLRRLPVRGTVT
jgi:hypothetical protein